MEWAHATVNRILLLYRKHTTVSSILTVVVFVLAANFVYLFVTNPDPLISRSTLPVQHGSLLVKLPFAGDNSIEGNDGITKQALGVQAAHQVLGGKLPLWNYYEGVGAPLLGETQSAASFPFTLLLVLPYGFLVNEIVLEMLAGIGMYLFIRHLRNGEKYRIDNAVAITGGCLFATLGTFMMLPNACFNPIAFLPWILLGVTLIFSGNRKLFDRQNVVAMLVFALGVALELNAGFPEIAYINLLLVVAYAAVLFVKTKRSEKVTKLLALAIPGMVAILLSLPWIVEFLTYTNPKYGSTGIHNHALLNGIGGSGAAHLASFIPNVIGFGSDNPVFGDIGGFFTVSSVVLALFAVCSRSIKLWHKVLFGGWFLIGWLRVIGVPVVASVIAHIPMLGSAAVYRYVPTSMSLCVIVLACLGLDQIVRNTQVNRRVAVGLVSFTVLFYGFILYGGRHYLKSFVLADTIHALFATFFLGLSVAASAAVLVAALTKWQYKKQLIILVLVLESFLCFVVWQFGAHTKTAMVDTRGVEFLQRNLGAQRLDSNQLRPNYGSYFNVAQLSMMDLPISKLWDDYIVQNLETYNPQIGLLSNKFDAARIEQDRFLGVKYLLVVKGSLDGDVVRQQNLKLAYSDENSQVFEIPAYRQYVSGANCVVVGDGSRDTFTVNCTEASQLRRLELFYPGWHAKIDGKEVAIAKADELFQQVNVPSGEHSVTFRYWPKYMTPALVGTGVGTVAIIAGVLYVAPATKAAAARFIKPVRRRAPVARR